VPLSLLNILTLFLVDIIVEKSKARHNFVLDYSRNMRLLQQLEEKIESHANAAEELPRRKDKLSAST